MTLNMAPFPPLSEDEKTFLPVLNTFLANADNQGLRTIVAKHSRETEIVAKDLAALRDAFHTLQSQFNEDRRSGIELRGTVEKLQGANQELRACNSELRGVNEELRTTIGKLTDTNTTLRIAPERAMKQVDALEKKVDDALDTIVDKLETAVDNTRTANQDLRSRLDQLHVDTRVLKDLQRQMHQCDARLVSTEFRQQNVEEVVEKLANIINGPPPSQELLVPGAGGELYQDPRTQPGRNSRKRHYAYDRDDELADPQIGKGSKRHARDSYQEDAISQPTKSSKQPPHLALQDAAEAEGLTAQPIKTRHAPTRAQKQPGASVSNDTGQVNPRWLAIKRHYVACKTKFDASKAKDQRRFIWEFIQGSGDDEFCTWFQKHLLDTLPSDKVNRATKKPRGPRNRIVALKPSLTWEEVRQVVRNMPVAPFLE